MSDSVTGIQPSATSVRLAPPEMLAFIELQRQGIFDKKLPSGVHQTNWLSASPEALKGVGPATAKLLAAKGLKTIQQVASSKAWWKREFPAAGDVLAKAHAALQAAIKKYGLGQPASLVDSPNSKPANVVSATIKQGFGAAHTTITVAYRTTNSAHVLVNDVNFDPSKITVRIADYQDPSQVGATVVRTKTATIDLGPLTTGASVELVNKDGRLIKRFATPATGLPGFGGPPPTR